MIELATLVRGLEGFIFGATFAALVVLVGLYFWTRRVSVEPHERETFYLIGKGGEDES